MIAGEFSEQVPPDRTPPIKFQMAQPVRRLHQRRPFAHGGVGDAHAIISGAKMNLLFHENEGTSESNLSRKFLFLLTAFCLLHSAFSGAHSI